MLNQEETGQTYEGTIDEQIDFEIVHYRDSYYSDSDGDDSADREPLKELWKEKGVEEQYLGDARRPYYRMRGKKISKEAAYEILRREAYKFTTDMLWERKDDAVLEEDMRPVFGNMPVHPLRVPCYDWIRTWIDEDGNVGENAIAYQWPFEYEFIEEQADCARRYPEDLEYVIIYSDYDEGDWDAWIRFECIEPPFYQMSYEHFMEKFSYAIWVKKGRAYVISKETADRLYRKYQAEYPSEEFFERNDYNDYIRPLISGACMERLMEDWALTEESKKQLRELNQWERLQKLQKEKMNPIWSLRIDDKPDEGTHQIVMDQRAKALDILEEAVKSGNLGLTNLRLREKCWEKVLALPLELFEDEESF